jgi:two-component system, OmpR family, KDP operon response regulator KdpE
MGLTASKPSLAAAAPRVLVVDDEPQLIRGLRIALRGAGYVLETTPRASDAVAVLAARPPDVLIVDLVLPDLEGIEVCRKFRRLSRLPIVIISALGGEREKARVLNAGADDYVAKPFRVEELLGRLRAVLPRSVEGAGTSTLEIGDLVIDLARRRVSLRGAAVLLESEEFELVSVLAQRQGRIVTDGHLLRASCGHERGFDTRELRLRMARLRAKLENDRLRPEYLIAEPGVGYRLLEPCEVVR